MHNMYLIRPYQKPAFHIETESDDLYQNIKIAYGKFIKNELLNNPSDIYNMSFYKKNGLFIFNNRGVEEKISEDYAFQAMKNIIYEETKIDEDILAVHSGVVAYKNKGFILAGYTHSGKSTLTAYLCAKGFEYLSDDLALIKKENLKLIPYDKPLHLRKGGYEVLKKYGINFSYGRELKYGDLDKIVIYPEKPEFSEYEMGGIFFIKRTEDLNKVVEVPKQKLILMLMQNQFIFSSPDSELLKVFVRLSNVNAYEIYYSDMEYVKKFLSGEENG